MDVRQPMEFDRETFLASLTNEQLIWLGDKTHHGKCNSCPFKCHTCDWMDIIEPCGYENCLIEQFHEDWWKK